MKKPRGRLLRVFLFVWCLLLPPFVAHSVPLQHNSFQSKRNYRLKKKHPPLKRLAAFGISRRVKQKVRLSIKLIYAHVRNKRYVDKRLKRDLPSLHQMFDFNAYQLLKKKTYQTTYQASIIVPISNGYRLKITPKKFNQKKQRILLQAIFMHRQKRKGKKKLTFKQYASTQIKLPNKKKVAFLGPTYRYGRVLIILHVKQI